MKKLLVLTLTVAAFAPLAVKAQTPTPSPLNFQQAAAVKRALVNPTYAACLAADNAILAAPDITQAQTGGVLSDKAVWMQRTGAAPADVIATYLAAYQAGNVGAFKSYLTHAYAAGDPARSAALALLPDFVNANGEAYPRECLVVQAVAQELQGQFAAALQSRIGAVDATQGYFGARGADLKEVIRVAKLNNTSAATLNGILIPRLTAYNVPLVDDNFKTACKAVNRGAISVSDLQAFLIKLLAVIDGTSLNAPFLGELKTDVGKITNNG